MKHHARIHVYTGDGEGKTSTALGLALRSVGHGRKVIIVQFMKGCNWIGEYKIMERLKPEYEIHQFGREDWVDLENPSDEDRVLARKGFEFAKSCLKKKPDLLILEEINLAAAIGLVAVDEVLALLKATTEDTAVILTGRRAPKEFIDAADLVTEMKRIKHPFKKGSMPQEGLEY